MDRTLLSLSIEMFEFEFCLSLLPPFSPFLPLSCISVKPRPQSDQMETNQPCLKPKLHFGTIVSARQLINNKEKALYYFRAFSSDTKLTRE